MSHSEDQKRQKADALREAEHHMQRNVQGDITRPSEQANQEREDHELMTKGSTRYQLENHKRFGGRPFGGDESDIASHKRQLKGK